ncbi:hypothetical protein [Thiocystis violacea]|uniref:hypothetical protein n=1 Tax=Thiocystis violacea TaxID=13725 RepID=UPI0019076F4B|nr:hypothetical protein [Thiocystis violacea]MBK1724468.1 hypothetical protein [Thiocystis violacea]
MAANERQRQKKLEKKNKKRQIAKKAVASLLPASRKASAYVDFPIHECLVPSGLFETGIGSILVSRRLRNGDIAVSAFVLDTFCLGVKNAFFSLLSEDRYELELKASMLATHEGQHFERLHPACMKKLITGAVHYAEDLGFQPHRDYKGAVALLNGIDALVCPTRFDFGSEGKPFYIRGPNESIPQAKRIVERLEARCGHGNYHFMIGLDPSSTESD